MLFFSDLPPKSPMVYYSTMAASMRNMTSSPWKSSMSRYSSPSPQVERLLVYLSIIGYIIYPFCKMFLSLSYNFWYIKFGSSNSHLCSTGETKTTVSPFIPGGVSDGQWHMVEVHYYNKVWFRVTLSEQTPTGTSYWYRSVIYLLLISFF